MIVSIDLSSEFFAHPSLASCADSAHPRFMPSPAEFFAWLGGAADFAEKHPTITIATLILILTFGTPEIGPAGKPWIRSRSGIGWFAIKMAEAYAERTQVWRDLKTEAEALAATVKASSERVGSLEKVVDWQTRVMLLIASTLKIDVTKTLDSGTVAVVSRDVPEPRKSSEDATKSSVGPS